MKQLILLLATVSLNVVGQLMMKRGMSSVGAITAQPRLRIRAEANAEAEIVGFGYPGQQFPVVEVSADGLWVFLGGVAGSENPNGGWAAAEFVTISE